MAEVGVRKNKAVTGNRTRLLLDPLTTHVATVTDWRTRIPMLSVKSIVKRFPGPSLEDWPDSKCLHMSCYH